MYTAPQVFCDHHFEYMRAGVRNIQINLLRVLLSQLYNRSGNPVTVQHACSFDVNYAIIVMKLLKGALINMLRDTNNFKTVSAICKCLWKSSGQRIRKY